MTDFLICRNKYSGIKKKKTYAWKRSVCIASKIHFKFLSYRQPVPVHCRRQLTDLFSVCRSIVVQHQLLIYLAGTGTSHYHTQHSKPNSLSIDCFHRVTRPSQSCPVEPYSQFRSRISLLAQCPSRMLPHPSSRHLGDTKGKTKTPRSQVVIVVGGWSGKGWDGCGQRATTVSSPKPAASGTCFPGERTGQASPGDGKGLRFSRTNILLLTMITALGVGPLNSLGTMPNRWLYIFKSPWNGDYREPPSPG